MYTIVTLLCFRCPERIHLMEGCILWLTSLHFSHLPAPGNHHSTICFYELGFFRFHIWVSITGKLCFKAWAFAVKETKAFTVQIDITSRVQSELKRNTDTDQSTAKSTQQQSVTTRTETHKPHSAEGFSTPRVWRMWWWESDTLVL